MLAHRDIDVGLLERSYMNLRSLDIALCGPGSTPNSRPRHVRGRRIVLQVQPDAHNNQQRHGGLQTGVMISPRRATASSGRTVSCVIGDITAIIT